MVGVAVGEGGVRCVVRHGREVIVLGDVLVEVVDPVVAVALSPGRFPKRRPTVDGNEDSVLAATAGARAVLAVADGHHGWTAAEAAIATCQQYVPKLLSVPEPAIPYTLEGLVAATGAAVVAARRRAGPPREDSGTALSVAVVAGRRLFAVTIGDTAVIRLSRRRQARRVGPPTAFLGATAPRADVHRARLRPGDRVVCASDGLLGFVGGPWEHHLADAGAAEPFAGDAVEALVRSAFAMGAADHIAVALWAGGDTGGP